MSFDDPPYVIAVEQCVWWTASGISPAEALEALGIRWAVPGAPDWHVVAEALELIWPRIPNPSSPDQRQRALKLVVIDGQELSS